MYQAVYFTLEEGAFIELKGYARLRQYREELVDFIKILSGGQREHHSVVQVDPEAFTAQFTQDDVPCVLKGCNSVP